MSALRTLEIRNEKPEIGFTLIEVMVGVVLTAILIIAATGIWISCTRGWTAAENHRQTNERDDAVIRRVRELFERTLVEQSKNHLYEWKCENQFEGTSASDRIEFVSQWPLEIGGGRTLLAPVRGELRLENPPGIRAGPAKWLSWRFAPFSAELTSSSEAETIVFSSEVQSVNFRYWWSEASRWVDDWREKGLWPQAIEVEVTFVDPADNSTRQRRFVVAVERPAPARPGTLEQQEPEANPEVGGEEADV